MPTRTYSDPAEIARKRVSSIFSVLPYAEASAAIEAATDGSGVFAELTDEEVADFLARFDKPGHWIARRSPADCLAAERATVGCILPSGKTVDFDCVGPENAGSWPRPESVNWPAIGSSSPADAAAFAAALAFAAGVAAMLDPNDAR